MILLRTNTYSIPNSVKARIATTLGGGAIGAGLGAIIGNSTVKDEGIPYEDVIAVGESLMKHNPNITLNEAFQATNNPKNTLYKYNDILSEDAKNALESRMKVKTALEKDREKACKKGTLIGAGVGTGIGGIAGVPLLKGFFKHVVDPIEDSIHGKVIINGHTY